MASTFSIRIKFKEAPYAKKFWEFKYLTGELLLKLLCFVINNLNLVKFCSHYVSLSINILAAESILKQKTL